MSTTEKKIGKAAQKKTATPKPTAVNKNTASHTAKKKNTLIITVAPMMEGAVPMPIPLSKIEFSPLNYRKYYSEEALHDFATELKLHGIISPVTVRPLDNGRYELVVGERRYRGATIAGLEKIPALVKTLTDEQVREIQLSENIQRENPHPMNEAQGIADMQKSYKTIPEIAARLGKSKQFVYSRLRLLSLIEPIREMFIENVFNIQEAFEIAALSQQSQQDFYDWQCTDWKEKGKFNISNLRNILSKYMYDLKKAPFDTEKTDLLPDVIACTACPSNSATLSTLFPDMAEQAVCSNKQCFQSKCNAHFSLMLTSEFLEYQPQAVVFRNLPSEALLAAIGLIPGADELPQYSIYDLSIAAMPTAPDKEDYVFDDENDELEFDEESFNAAVEEYYSDLEEFNTKSASGALQRALYITDGKVERLLFSLRSQQEEKPKGSAKAVAEAIKAGTVTVELLEDEITRIENKEKRAKELDREKVQLAVHEAMVTQLEDATCPTLTTADMAAARLLVFQSLDWSNRHKVRAALIPSSENLEISEHEHLYQTLANLPDEQFSYLIRMALAGKADSKIPAYETGYFLYKVAEAGEIDVAAIEAAQEQKAKDRNEKLDLRKGELNYKIKKLKGTKKDTGNMEQTDKALPAA